MIHQYMYLFVKKKVFNYSELHFSEGTCYKIHSLENFRQVSSEKKRDNSLNLGLPVLDLRLKYPFICLCKALEKKIAFTQRFRYLFCIIPAHEKQNLCKHILSEQSCTRVGPCVLQILYKDNRIQWGQIMPTTDFQTLRRACISGPYFFWSFCKKLATIRNSCKSITIYQSLHQLVVSSPTFVFLELKEKRQGNGLKFNLG